MTGLLYERAYALISNNMSMKHYILLAAYASHLTFCAGRITNSFVMAMVTHISYIMDMYIWHETWHGYGYSL